MASWQAKHRDPLFDQSTQAALERRGKELLGAGLVVIGIIVALMLSSWSPEDPSFLSATDEPAQNILGSFGAYAASPLMMIAGYGSWMLVVAALVWGLRFMLHRGRRRRRRALRPAARPDRPGRCGPRSRTASCGPCSRPSRWRLPRSIAAP